MRLLIAENDPRLLKTLSHIFESNKFIVDRVSNGEDALAYAQSEEYDGLVLDTQQLLRFQSAELLYLWKHNHPVC